MKQAIVIFAEECCSASIQLQAKKLQLSNDTVTQRIACISNNQRDQIFHKSKNFVYYSVALDTSKDFANTEQLAVFIWRFMLDFMIYKKYLILRSIHGSTKGKDILYFVNFRLFYWKHNWTHQSCLQWQPMDVLPCLGQIKDSSASGIKKMLLLKSCSCDWASHFAKESLAAKSLDMSNVTRVIISTINWI